jgi:hypothetical protein
VKRLVPAGLVKQSDNLTDLLTYPADTCIFTTYSGGRGTGAYATVRISLGDEGIYLSLCVCVRIFFSPP